MELTTIAKPYVKALNAITLQNNGYEGWKTTLQALSKVVDDSAAKDFLNSPSISHHKKFGLISKSLSVIIKAELTQLESNFINLLIANSRLNISTKIAELFIANNQENSKYINVISAYELSTNEQSQLVQDLSVAHNCPIILNLTIDETLIGGIVIKDGDKVIDLSVDARAKKLATRLLNN